MPELNPADKAVLVALLKQTIFSDPFPLSPRVTRLKELVAKLDPEAARPSVAQRISLGLRRLPPRPLRGQPRAAPRETAARSSVRPTVRGWLRSVEMRPATDVGSCASPS